jgi:uncharacterized membrane protein YgdD (TMEM256/DUF423 family)
MARLNPEAFLGSAIAAFALGAGCFLGVIGIAVQESNPVARALSITGSALLILGWILLLIAKWNSGGSSHGK